VVLIGLLIAPAIWAQAANKRVCVEVIEVDEAAAVDLSAAPSEAVPADEQADAKAVDPWQLAKPEAKPAKRARTVEGDTSFLPLGQTPIVYLKRLLEHFVTHEKNHEAVRENCQETLRVELYPLASGWTVFARYSGNGREERVDKLYPSELSQFSERAVLALLADVPISATINRENVLRADSEKSAQRIKGTHHFVLGLGTQPRGGNFDTAAGADEPTEKQIRIFTPMTISTGYRGKFENWGIEAMAQLGIGTQQTAARNNTLGGNIDFGGTAEIQLHFFHYFNPRGLNSVYLGSGATFELMWFTAIKPAAALGDDRSTLLGGGLDVDLVFGWEFMRASSVQFFLQTELHVPAFALQNQDNYGELHTWFPGLSVKLGVMF
jgi:hypothetical protein